MCSKSEFVFEFGKLMNKSGVGVIIATATGSNISNITYIVLGIEYPISFDSKHLGINVFMMFVN